MKKKSKILIIGGTRYVGLKLFNDLKKNKSLKIYTLSRSRFNHKNHISCDRNNYNKLRILIKKINPQIIIDMINFSEKNSKDIKNLFEKDEMPSLKHYIVISSFFVYNFFDLKKFREKKLISNKKIIIPEKYTRNKIKMEKILYSSKIFDITTIIRFPFIFSYDDYTGRFQKICEVSKNSKNRNFKGKKFSMISKHFAVKCLKHLIYSKPKKIIDLSNKGYVDINKIIKTINGNLNYKIKFKKNFLIKNIPYFINRKLCIKTKKINFQENLIYALKKESKLYFIKNNK